MYISYKINIYIVPSSTEAGMDCQTFVRKQNNSALKYSKNPGYVKQNWKRMIWLYWLIMVIFFITVATYKSASNDWDIAFIYKCFILNQWVC